jgi:hypothetical protein
MARRLALFPSASALSSALSVTIAPSAAHAVSFGTNIPGKVTCSPAGGVWNGTITFTPPLFNGKTANTETLVVKALLGNTESSCIANTGIVAFGSIKGKLTFSIPGSANNCATIFSGVTLPAPTGVQDNLDHASR